MKTDKACPHCGANIPSTSVYCPKCGESVDEEVTQPTQAAPKAATPQRPAMTYNQQRQAAQQRAQQQSRQANAWQKPAVDDEENEEENTDGKNSNFNRNLVIGVIAAVVLIALLSLLRHCNSAENDLLEARVDSAVMAADDSQDPLAILQTELDRASMSGDKALPACAVRFNKPNTDSLSCIVGVTYKNDTDRPFIKIYKLTRDGGSWKPELAQTKYFDSRTINMDNNALIVDPMYVPRAVTVSGKQCLYFALMNNLRGSENGRVTLYLFDVESKALTALNYDGQLRQRTDGRLFVYAQPFESINTPERRFLAQEAANIGAIHVPTAAELEADRLQAEQAMQDSVAAAPVNTTNNWSQDNAENMNRIKNGEEVKMHTTVSDKPTINIKDIKTKLENDNYIVFLDNGGSVKGFNKTNRKYFSIYGDTKNPASSISLSGGSVIIKTGSGSISYNLTTDQAKKVD